LYAANHAGRIGILAILTRVALQLSRAILCVSRYARIAFDFARRVRIAATRTLVAAELTTLQLVLANPTGLAHRQTGGVSELARTATIARRGTIPGHERTDRARLARALPAQRLLLTGQTRITGDSTAGIVDFARQAQHTLGHRIALGEGTRSAQSAHAAAWRNLRFACDARHTEALAGAVLEGTRRAALTLRLLGNIGEGADVAVEAFDAAQSILELSGHARRAGLLRGEIARRSTRALRAHSGTIVDAEATGATLGAKSAPGGAHEVTGCAARTSS
jgi:hypothetical protein